MHVALALIGVGKHFANGGIPKAVLNRCHMLTECGYRVSVIACFANPAEPVPFEGVRLVHVPVRRRAPQAIPALNDLFHGKALGAALAKLHAKDPVDIVDVQEPNMAPGVYPVAERAGIAKVHSVHLSCLVGKPRFSPTRQAVLKKINLYAANEAVANISVSEFAKDGLVRNGVPASKIHVVYNPIPIPDLPPKPGKRPDGPIRILSLGRMVEGKGVEEAVEGAVLLKGLGVSAKWTFVGDGPKKEAAERRCREAGIDAEFAGQVNSGETINRYRFEHDIFISTSEHEISPLVVAEGMAAGMAILASDIPPHLELMGDTGWSYPGGNPQALAEQLRKLATDRDAQLDLGARARQRAERMFGWDTIRAGLDSVYKHVATANEQL